MTPDTRTTLQILGDLNNEHLAELSAQDHALLEMARLCKLARVECMSPRSVQAQLLDQAIRLVDPTWQPTKSAAREPWPTNGQLGTTRLKEKRR